MTDVPPALPTQQNDICEHAQPFMFSREIAVCPVCGSFRDLAATAAALVYDDDYPESRFHFDTTVGAMKVATLRAWLAEARIDPTDATACEVGFGGGYCLAYLQRTARKVYGIEAVAANMEHAIHLGVHNTSLFHVDSLPSFLPLPVALWVFQDSFEHIPAPADFTEWVLRNSAPDARVLLVAPNATSLSQKLMGRWWPHRMSDHCFHWSRQGITDFFAVRGFALERTFNPQKVVSVKMLMNHLLLQHKKAAEFISTALPTGLADATLRFNIGEMGLLFRRESDGHR